MLNEQAAGPDGDTDHALVPLGSDILIGHRPHALSV
jgi:hypothetical protein